jgi:hypothetical protein
VCLAAGAYLRVTNHALHLLEVTAGANGDSTVQFLVIAQEAGGQQLWGPQAGETQSRAQLVFSCHWTGDRTIQLPDRPADRWHARDAGRDAGVR